MQQARTEGDPMQLTSSVYTDGVVSHLIYIDDVETCYAKLEYEAKDIVKSFADREVARLRDLYQQDRKITTENYDDGKKIVVYSQKLGTLWDGAVVVKMVVRCVPIPRASYRYTSHAYSKQVLPKLKKMQQNEATQEVATEVPLFPPTIQLPVVPLAQEVEPKPVEIAPRGRVSDGETKVTAPYTPELHKDVHEEKKSLTGPKPVEPVLMKLKRGDGQPARWERVAAPHN